MSATPRYSRLDPGQRREQILDAANALFSERGYDEVSVEDIAGSAGVTRGLVHHYFGGRKEVYIALLERLGAIANNNYRRRWAAAPVPAWPTRWPAGWTGPRPTARSGWPRSGAARTSPTPTSGKWSPSWCAAPSRWSPPATPTSPSRLAAAALRARVLDRTQPRRHPPLATRRSHPPGHTRTARLHARARPAHLRRPTRAKPACISYLRSEPSSSMPASGDAAGRLTRQTTIASRQLATLSIVRRLSLGTDG